MPKTTNKTKAQTPKQSIVSEVESRWNENAKSENPPAEVVSDSPLSEKPQNNRIENKGSGTPFPTREVGSGTSGERVSLKIVDGKFDAESLTPRVAERVREVMKNTMSDEEARKLFGLTMEAAPMKHVMTPETAGAIFDGVAKGQTWLLCKRTALPYSEVYPLVKWDKDEHEFLDGRAANLANKYCPESWLKYSDAGAFLLGLSQIIQAKNAAVEEYARKKLERIGAATTPAATAPPKDAQPATPTKEAKTLTLGDIPPDQKARSLE